MRILHLTTFVQGGAGLALVQLATAQRSDGHGVVVVTSHTAPPGYGNYAAHLAALVAGGVPVHTIDSSFSRDAAANRHVAQFVQQALGGAEAFDLIHTHAGVPTAIALSLTAGVPGARVPVVQTMHGWGLHKTADHTRTDLNAMRRADRVVVPSEHSKHLLTSMGMPERMVSVISYGVEPMTSAPSPSDPLLREMREWRLRGGDVICTTGTVGARKNQGIILESLTRLLGPESLLCVVVGEGDTGTLQTDARRLGVDERVRICGHRPDARVVSAAADYFILPSLSEGQPLAILEAWADGVPVLCSRTPELVELTGHGQAAVLFDPRDADDVARAITTVRRTVPAGRQRLADRARARYREHFTAQRMVDDYTDEYRRLVATRRAVA